MWTRKLIVLLIIALSGNFISHATVYKELVPDFSHKESRVSVRVIDKPTLANLGVAAYISNPVRFDPEKHEPDVDTTYTLNDMTFERVLENAVNSRKKLPLTKQEQQSPLAWKPLMEELWKKLQFDNLKKKSSVINSEKWGDPSIFKPFQEVVAAYIHDSAGKEKEIWVEVEFKFWVNFIKGITDNDDDGTREIYGKLDISDLQNDSAFHQSIRWIEETYMQEELSHQEVIDWFNVLASYWYPTLNTDVMEIPDDMVFPDKDIEKAVRKDMGDVKVKDPTVIIKGVPHEKPIYNVFIIRGLEEKKQSDAATTTIERNLDSLRSKNFKANNKRFAQELKEHGGSYEEWYNQLNDFISSQKALINRMHPDNMGIVGKNGWLFFKKSLEYTTAKDLTKQTGDKNAFKHIVEFNDYLADKGIDMLFVPMPSKIEIYPEKINNGIVPPKQEIIQPYGRKFLRELQQAGVEVIDLLPLYLQAKHEISDSNNFLYQKKDTHWKNKALQIAAKTISERLKQYAWYKEATQKDYTRKMVSFKRQGDIVKRLPDSIQSNYPPAKLTGSKIFTPDGNAFKRNPNAEIMLIGDSFTGVFELIDCKSAGIGANIAYHSSLPLDIVTSWGGGPLVRAKMLRSRKEYMNNKRVVIYLMVDRDLYNYSQGWESIDEMEK